MLKLVRMETAKAYCVRRMQRKDINQVVEIDREAFPGTWPVPNYRRELENRLAYYIVVCDRDQTVPATDGPPIGGFQKFVSKVSQLIGGDGLRRGNPAGPGRELVLGFAGIWVLVDEAHLTNIAVRQSERERGVGELLLISMIELSQKLKTVFVTLEVRVSNTTAQTLYTKYGFKEVGLRRHYYTDNREDALLMTTDGIGSAPYRAQLQALKQLYIQKWGNPAFRFDR
ncbi:MAG: ribosomal protein S18-alanine N-acetyltransferase [Chloroflexota bacterium]